MIKAFIICIAVMLVSCSTSNEPSEQGRQAVTALLYERWVLVRTSGGFSGTTIDYPDRSQSVRFTVDGNATSYDRDSITSITTYAVEFGPCIVTPDSVDQLRYATSPVTQIISRLTRDTLILTDNVYDGLTYVYERR